MWGQWPGLGRGRVGAVARVAAAETGWGQKQCRQLETPALSYSKEQVMPQTKLVPALCPVLLPHDYSIYLPSYLALRGEGIPNLGNGRHKAGVMCPLLQRTSVV